MIGAAKFFFLLLVLSLPLMKPSVEVGGLEAKATDLLFLLTAASLALALLTGRTRLRWHRLFAILIVYFLAMSVCTWVSPQPGRALVKLASQAYLLSLPVLAYQLVDTADDLRRIFRWWLAATAITAVVGTLTVLLFVAGIGGPLLRFALHEYGTLRPGSYPRIEATFEYPALLCNYLTVSLAVLLVSHRLGWIGSRNFVALLAAIAVTAIFSLTPGLGGFLLAIGLWLWLVFGERSRPIAALAITGGVTAALLFLAAASVTPILHPTAPFLIDVPASPMQLAPSVRMLTWIDAARNVLAHPLLGLGNGSPAADVFYIGPSGAHHRQTDAHNVYLNMAAQCGLVGLGALLLLMVGVARETGPLRLSAETVVPLGLGLAWLNAFAYQGLTGSYEDARYLWLLLGLLIAGARLAHQIRRENPAPGSSPTQAGGRRAFRLRAKSGCG
ncbi:hypothetical protein C7I55_09015 [Sphingomonas deserti]|uniref:O-antigen ligase-related domain-containing protein n=2 Tax=Allosphingosinicella deserti TaxID=2116704 RepID=A0A2P7QR84_9SPHN|nr:hypothetical protein C7I55_09015 [Sphingomonas deserti]